jgi:hypothetical protein
MRVARRMSMRMATRRKRWIATGGATAAVAIGIWTAVALAAPSVLTGPSITNVAAHFSWAEGDATVTGTDLQRATGQCTGTPSFSTLR